MAPTGWPSSLSFAHFLLIEIPVDPREFAPHQLYRLREGLWLGGPERPVALVPDEEALEEGRVAVLKPLGHLSGSSCALCT